MDPLIPLELQMRQVFMETVGGVGAVMLGLVLWSHWEGVGCIWCCGYRPWEEQGTFLERHTPKRLEQD